MKTTRAIRPDYLIFALVALIAAYWWPEHAWLWGFLALHTTAPCTSFKQQLLIAGHDFTAGTGDVFKLLLIKSGSARTYDGTQTSVGTPGAGTPGAANVGTDEVAGTGYTSGGVTLTSVTPAISSTSGVCDFNPDPSWSGASFTVTAAIIYNNSARVGAAGRSCSVHDLGGPQTVTAGTLTLVMPTPDSANAILRVGP